MISIIEGSLEPSVNIKQGGFMFIESYSYVDGNSYVVFYPYIVNGRDGIFVLHIQGDLRKLESWFNYVRALEKPIYFCDSTYRSWDNHKEKVGMFDNGNVIYKLKGFRGIAQ